jgi:MFS family permease
MLGTPAGGMFIYTNGVFMEAVTRAFGWSRAEFSSAFVWQTILSLLILPPIGSLVDRVGPRKVALPGIVTFVIGFALLTLANGKLWQWWLLCLLQYAGAAAVTPAVWVAAVVDRFQAARGSAMAVALAGLGIGTMAWPIVAAYLLQAFGWRAAFAGLGVAWGLAWPGDWSSVRPRCSGSMAAAIAPDPAPPRRGQSSAPTPAPSDLRRFSACWRPEECFRGSTSACWRTLFRCCARRACP